MKRISLVLVLLLLSSAAFAISPIMGTTVTCVGASETLSDATTGGTWSSSNTAIITIGSSSGICTGISTGTAVISYSVGGPSVTMTIAVYTHPAAIAGTPTICQGASTTLFDVTPGMVWSSGNTSVATIGSSSGNVAGISPGTATISYGVSPGCNATFPMTILLTPVPIIGSTYICTGGTSLLSDGTPGGTWSSSDPTVATVGSSTGLVTGVGPVTAIISYTLPPSMGVRCRAMVTVTVDALPAPISGNDSVCVGQSTTLTSSGSGTWASGSAHISIGSSTGIVTGLSAGTATVTYTSSGGCASSTVVFKVNPGPAVITGVTSICVFASTTLSDAITGGTWSSLDPSIGDFSSPSVGILDGYSAGTSTITYMLGTGCFVTTTATVNPAPAPITGPSKMCTGLTYALSDATTGGSWSSSNTAVATIATSGIVTCLSPGTITITYTSPTGCYAFQTITVSALPLPITGVMGMCIGSTTFLSDITGGGIWSSGNTSVATISGGIVTGHTAGTATITYTIFSTGCLTTTVVTVGSASPPIAGPATLCAGASVILSDAMPGGSWTSGNTSVATVGSGTGLVTGLSAGTAKISYALMSSCPATLTVTVNPLPLPIAGAAIVCPGSSVTLSDGISGGTWSSSATSVAAIGPSSGVCTGLATGTATISYTLSMGCVVTRSVTVDILPVAGPITGVDTVCVGHTITLSDAGSGVWLCANTKAIVTGYGVILGLAPGIDTVIYTVTNACGSASASFTVTVFAVTHCTPLGIAENEEMPNSIKVFPNPNDGSFSINIQSSGAAEVNVVITNLLGERVKELTVKTGRVTDVQISQPPGIYFLSTTIAGNRTTEKLIVR
jgi:trimeric autotransporter adhesin